MNSRLIFALALFAASHSLTHSIAQTNPLKRISPNAPVVCYQKPRAEKFSVGPPEVFETWRKNATARVKTTNIEVEYINFPADNLAKNAFQYAVDIWETQLTSSVPIKLRAEWGPLGSGVLGQATWGAAFANFNGAQHQNVYYPVALAEKISGTQLNASNEPDIVATFSSNISNWYYGTDGNVPAGKMDLVTVVLHEICHGLGFVDSYATNNGQGSVGLSNVPFVYDLYVVNSSKQSLFSGFPSPSESLNTQLTSNSLFYNSTLAANGATLPKIYAPSNFDAGSSIAHLDETTFSTPGNANNLMTPQIAQQEAIHQPGSIALAILSDMGWVRTRIDHTPLKDSERKDGNGYPVTAAIVSDNGYKVSTVMLNYRSSPNVPYTSVQMQPTATPNLYQASLPGSTNNITYAYYISVQDNLSRTYTNPGAVYTQNQSPEQNFNLINIGPDTDGPEITHTPVDFVYDTDTQLLIEANVTDNIEVSFVKVEFEIDGGSTQTVTMSKSAEPSTYSATISLPASLTIGDLIRYRVVTRDNSSQLNQSTSPVSGFYTVFVTGDMPAANSYVNDFNQPSFDFIGNSFSVQTPNGFTNPSIHSEHPYKDGSDENDESNYIYQLQVPIIISESNHYIKFDEIVLVEPGENGSVFGQQNFFDYVVVEGSKDNGVNWIPFENGYDSRANSAWLARYNSAISGDNSTATGIPSLYRDRLIDMTSSPSFKAGDQVKIRFRLFADQAAHGWGWAIDNLSIQGPLTGIEYPSNRGLAIYPNPIKDLATIETFGKMAKAKIFDTGGRQILQIDLAEGKNVIDLSKLASGFYYLRFFDGKEYQTLKFLKSH